jgi:hypothetical protein
VVGVLEVAPATAPDAEPEGNRPLLLGILAPVGALAVLIPAYIWFNFQLIRWMQS